MQVPSDYVIGPGDELHVAPWGHWGQVQGDLRVIVDRSGQVYVPQVGEISVAAVHYGELETYLKNQISRIFKNFNLMAGMGRLRTIQVFVVGEARASGTYTISALSSLVNAIFACGGRNQLGLRDHSTRESQGSFLQADLDEPAEGHHRKGSGRQCRVGARRHRHDFLAGGNQRSTSGPVAIRNC
jgi:protein involved in polysaccharide export with SLBB domain